MNLQQFLEQVQFESFVKSNESSEHDAGKWQSLLTEWLKDKQKPVVEAVSMHDLLNSFRKLAGIEAKPEQVKEAEPAQVEVQSPVIEEPPVAETPPVVEEPCVSEWMKIDESGKLNIQGKMPDVDKVTDAVLSIEPGFTEVRIVSKPQKQVGE